MHQRPNTIECIDPDEEKLAEVRKHAFGIIIMFIQTVVALVAAFALILFVGPSVFSDSNQAIVLTTAFGVVALFLSGILLLVMTYIYYQNRLVITDRNITQILQYSLFSRKVSQLNIVNVEDVTAFQHGFLPTLFNYGILRIETAGEQSNFEFEYCPNPGYIAKLILDAREAMLGQGGDEPGEGVSSSKRTFKQTNTDDDSSGTKYPKSKRRDHRSWFRGMGAEVIERAHEPPDDN